MKIVAINGSFRGERGLTSKILTEIGKGAAKVNNSYLIPVNLADKKIYSCTACNICKTEKSYLRCVFTDRDDVADIFDLIRSADFIIYGTPIYALNISSLLKKFIERFYGISDIYRLEPTKSGHIFHHTDRNIIGKPFMGLVVCDSFENKISCTALTYFRNLSIFFDAPYYGTIVRNLGFIAERYPDDIIVSRFPLLKKVFDTYRKIGYSIAKYGKVSKRMIKKACIDIIPVPMFGKLKRLKFFRRKILPHAKRMMEEFRQTFNNPR